MGCLAMELPVAVDVGQSVELSFQWVVWQWSSQWQKLGQVSASSGPFSYLACYLDLVISEMDGFLCYVLASCS
uniref:Uncharacterized protein n=1 Tax=Arundo donax TaxID=35708 RepID=A0A0A9EIL0_ARUDO